MRLSTLVASIALVAAVTPGCSSGTPDSSLKSRLVTVTVVHENTDKTITVNRYWATPEEVARATKAAQEGVLDDAIHPAAVQPPPSIVGEGSESVAQTSSAISSVTCGSSTFHLYDLTGCTGNVICFDGAGSADLTTYYDWLCDDWGNCWQSMWSNEAYSFASGTRGGYLLNTTWGHAQYFNGNQSCTNTAYVPRQGLTLY